MASNPDSISADERLYEEVYDTLMWDPDVDASDIQIDVRDGVVFLTGTVRDESMRTAAQEDATVVPGVKIVKNEITMGNDTRHGRGDH